MAKLWESPILHGQSSQHLLQAVPNGWVLKLSHPSPASAFTPAFTLCSLIQDVMLSEEWYSSPTSINVTFPRRERETKKNTVSALLLGHTNPFLLCGSIAVLLPCSIIENGSVSWKVTSHPFLCWAALTRVPLLQYALISRHQGLSPGSLGTLQLWHNNFSPAQRNLSAGIPSALKPIHPALPFYHLHGRGACCKGWHSALSVSHGSCSEGSSHPTAAQHC